MKRIRHKLARITRLLGASSTEMNQLGSSSRDQQPQQLQEQDRQLENRRRAEAAASGATAVIGGQQNQNQQPNQNQILHQRHHPHPPPQPCPRCSSTNTKFCYYNNYSLAQPRFFCKACRRYWTHGGTLRNVPVGGGGRKTKRLRVDDAHNRPRQQQQQQPLVLPQPPPAPSEQADSPSKITAAPLMTPGASSASANNQAGSTPTAAITAVYPATGGGFLSSLTASQAMIGQPLASRGGFGHLFMNMGDGAGGQSNLGLLQSLLGTQIHHNLYPTSSVEENLIQATAPAAIPPSSGPSMSPSHNDWQTFMGNVGPPGSDPRYWSIGRSSGDASGGGAGSSRDIGASSSPNRWPEFPSCGPDDVDDGS